MVRVPLTLVLLPSITAAQELIRVCGSDYGDASYNCTVNPPCVTGDGCPAEKDTCFAVPESECFSPPTASPTETPLKVCALDYPSALANCTGIPCDGVWGCPEKMACFTVFPSECVDDPPPDDNATLAEDAVDANFTAALESNSTDLYLCAASFEEAASNCTADATCTPGGAECAIGQACFVVPLESCVNSTAGNVTETASPTLPQIDSPSPSVANTTLEPPAAFPTVPPVQPEFIYVCGDNYTDADLNVCVNQGCPDGDGCPGDMTCYAFPFTLCSEGGEETTTVLPTTPADVTTLASFLGTTSPAGNDTITTVPSGNDTITTVSSGDGTTTVLASDTNASIGEVNATAPAIVGGSPTASPLPNLFFCGESYELAVMNCFTNQPCPSKAAEECPSGQACFEIPSQCIPPQPTASPSEGATILISTETTLALAANETNSTAPPLTSAEPSLAPISVSPTASPIVNTHFCGINYTDAELSCDFDTACPAGFECPSGQTCFTGIVCPATAAAEAPPTSSPASGMTTPPTLRGTAPSTTADSMLGSIAGTAPASFNDTDSSSARVYRYCGFTPEDAADNCAINTPCPDGTSDVCFAGQTCFELSDPCEASSPVATPVASPAPTTAKPVFDPSITSYCGIDYTDATENCYRATPCPGNSNAECPSGQTCFPGIVGCELPATETGVPTSAPDEGGDETNVTVSSGSIVPTIAPSKKPSFGYDFPGFGESSADRNDSSRVRGNCHIGVLVVSGVMGVMATMLL